MRLYSRVTHTQTIDSLVFRASHPWAVGFLLPLGRRGWQVFVMRWPGERPRLYRGLVYMRREDAVKAWRKTVDDYKRRAEAV